MKAIDLLREFDKDSQLAEYGMIIDVSADVYIKNWFGEDAVLSAGRIEIENFSTPYYVLYESNSDRVWGFVEKHPADAVVRTDEDKIYLWRIEDGDVD